MSANTAIMEMLESYHCQNARDVVGALREIMQNVALFALSQTDFFQKAAFYGGTALRILYGLNRGSEDMDFTLLKQDVPFDLKDYSKELEMAFSSFGLHAVFVQKLKINASHIQSGFLKSNTQAQMLSVGVGDELTKGVHPQGEIKIKVEVDIVPPEGGESEMRYVYQPLPFVVRSCTLPTLLAGKLHAVLFRKWGTRIKGRDWYDLAWYAAKHPEYNLKHLERRSRQALDYHSEKPLTPETVLSLLRQRLEGLDMDAMRADVLPFLRNPQELDVWSREFFLNVFERLKGV